MPATDEEVGNIAMAVIFTVFIISALYFARTTYSLRRPEEPKAHRLDSLEDLETRVVKLETQMLELSALATRCQALDSITTCDYAALLRRTIALVDRAEQLEPLLLPNDIKDS